MVAPPSGTVVRVPFPLSDLTQTRLRPAVGPAAAGRGDWALCQVTSNPYGDPLAVPLDAADFAAGGVQVASGARPGNLFSAHAGLFVRAVSELTPAALGRVLSAVAAVLQPPATP